MNSCTVLTSSQRIRGTQWSGSHECSQTLQENWEEEARWEDHVLCKGTVCMAQDQRRCQQGEGGYSERLLQVLIEIVKWVRSANNSIQFSSCMSYVSAPADIKDIFVRDLNSGIDIHVKFEKKTKSKQTKATARHHLLIFQPTMFLCQSLAFNSGKKLAIYQAYYKRICTLHVLENRKKCLRRIYAQIYIYAYYFVFKSINLHSKITN